MDKKTLVQSCSRLQFTVFESPSIFHRFTGAGLAENTGFTDILKIFLVFCYHNNSPDRGIIKIYLRQHLYFMLTSNNVLFLHLKALDFGC